MKIILHPTVVVALLLFPILLIVLVLNWQPMVLVFIFLAYSTFLVGFWCARHYQLQGQSQKKQAEVFQILTRSLGEVVIIHRMDDHTNIFVSPSVTKVLGYDEDFILNKYTTFIIHPDDRKLLIPKLKMDCLQQNASFELLLRIRKVDGDYQKMLLKGRGIKEKDGDLIKHTILSLHRTPAIQGLQIG